MVMVLLVVAVGARAEPRCVPDMLSAMPDEQQRAMAMEVYQRVAQDADKRDGGEREQKRLEQAAGGRSKMKDCEAWAEAHGKPRRDRVKGPR